MMKYKNNYENKKGAGFTLIEILISLSIFSLLVFAVSTIYVAFNNSQIRTSASQQLLNDSQYVMELMTREIRTSSIIYPTPPASFGSTWCDNLIDPTGNYKVFENCIILEREDGQSFAFTTSENTSASLDTDLYYILLDCTADYSSCDGGWKNIATASNLLLGVTLNDINIDSLNFYITPSSDPFVTGGPNSQPKVTINMTTSYNSQNRMKNVDHNFQTTVSSRIYRR